ncbi:MAG TPA: hypothetical protein VK302_03865 [Terriglobales bacterium]|nr:hypothetical protein [Terriglobales bacterium]
MLAVVAALPVAAIAQTVDLTQNSKGLILDPLAGFNPGAPDPTAIIQQDLSGMCSGPPDVFASGFANIPAFWNIGSPSYGAITIVSHGFIDDTGQLTILAYDEVTDATKTAYASDVNSQPPRIEQYHQWWAITPTFVQYYGKGPQNRIVLASTCDSYLDTTFSDAFFGFSSGEQAYLGYNNSVSLSYEYLADASFYETLTDLTRSPDQRTVQQALQQAYQSSPPLQLAAGSDPNLVLEGGVVNGNFDTGDFTGWTVGFTTVATENSGGGPFPEYESEREVDGSPDVPCVPAADGPYSQVTKENPVPPPTPPRKVSHPYSARIGAWGTPFVCLDPQDWCPYEDYPDVEPAGDDYIYQDVQLGSGGPSGPTSFTLNYSWDMESENYDGASDYFYVLIEDPSSTPDHPTILAIVLPPTSLTGFCSPMQDSRMKHSPMEDSRTEDSPMENPPSSAVLCPQYVSGSTAALPSQSSWQQGSFDLSAFAGQTVRLLFGEYEDGWGDQTATFVGNVSIGCALEAPAGPAERAHHSKGHKDRRSRFSPQANLKR